MEYTEETGNPEDGTYQKKIVREGPGFVEVTIVSGGGGAGLDLGDIFGGLFGPPPSS
jgi:hypothetical protein